MAYTGIGVPIPIGSGGLLTDLSPDLIPPKNLIKSNNVQIRNGVIEKAFGSTRWNSTPLSSGIVALHDFWANPGKQFTICVTRDGRVWRFSDRYTVTEITPTTDPSTIAASGTPPTALTISERVHIVEGGNEYLGAGALAPQPRKLFIFTGNDPVQVIHGLDTVRTNLRVPAVDWNGSDNQHKGYPTFGIIFLNRLFVLGNSNLPYFAYASSNTYGGSPFMYGHEDFSETTFNTALFNVYPGDGERLKSMFKYKGLLWALKYPRGLYSLNVPDIGVPGGWYFQKVNDDVGTPTISGTAPVLDDTWVMNSTGTIQSLAATLNLGGVTVSNVLKNLSIEKYIQQYTSPLGFGDRQAIWHEAKSTAYFLYRQSGKNLNSFLIAIDFTQTDPRPTIILKDQPNVLAIRRDVSQVEELIYGSEDGYIYTMDRASRLVGDPQHEVSQTAYLGEFQTPHMALHVSPDFRYNMVSDADKNFDFVEIEYIPTGDVTLSCDVYVDGSRTETISFILNKSNQLDSFVLDSSRLQGRSTRRQRKAIHGRGRTVSLRFYNSGLNENFRITGLTVYVRISGVDAKGSSDAGTRNNT